MGKRFDEVELETLVPAEEPFETATAALPGNAAPQGLSHAALARRVLTSLTDFSLFLALALALSPLIPERADLATTIRSDWPALISLVAFILMVSYYYFVGSWMLWGKTVGGALFDVKVIPADGTAMDVRRATKRWASISLALLSAGVGFLMAALPSRRSLLDRVSRTIVVAAPM
jgi:uncharacterized RDD family membrane protein YckC